MRIYKHYWYSTSKIRKNIMKNLIFKECESSLISCTTTGSHPFQTIRVEHTLRELSFPNVTICRSQFFPMK